MEDKLTIQAGNLAQKLTEVRTQLIHQKPADLTIMERIQRINRIDRLRLVADRAIARMTRRFMAACETAKAEAFATRPLPMDGTEGIGQ
jgi:hypothetical protein